MNRFVYMEDHLVLPHVLYLNNMFDPKIEVHDLYLTNKSVFKIDDIYLLLPSTNNNFVKFWYYLTISNPFWLRTSLLIFSLLYQSNYAIIILTKNHTFSKRSLAVNA